MSVLVLGAREEYEIKLALEMARKNVVPWSILKDTAPDDQDSPILQLADRKPNAPPRPSPIGVTLGSYMVAISFEEQPLGIIKHISVSSKISSKVPTSLVMSMICRAFGFSNELCNFIRDGDGAILERAYRIWMEEYATDRMATNVVEIEL